MPFSLRRDRTIAPDQVRRYTRTAVIALLFLFALVAASYTAERARSQGEQAQHRMAVILGRFHAQDAVQWRVVSGRSNPGSALSWLNQNREDTVSAISSLHAPGLRRTQIEALISNYQRYGRAVDHEMGMVNDGRADLAATYAVDYVDPVFEETQRRLAGMGRQVEASTRRSERLAEVGTALSFALAVVLILLLGGGRRFARVIAETRARGIERYRMLAAESSSMVVVLHRDGYARFLTPAAERMLDTGPTKDGLVDRSDIVLRRIHPDDRHLLLTSLVTVRPDSRPLRSEIRWRAVDVADGEKDEHGTWRIYEVSFRDHTDEPWVQGVLVTAHDITRQRELQNEIQRRALHDDLTGLPNRALLTDRIQQALRDGSRHGIRLGLMIIDLDRFKEINDTLGHHYGDELLIQVGEALKRALRGVDTVARLGGDEFAVLLPQVSDINGACAVAWKLHDALEDSFVVEGVELDVEASIGVAVSDLGTEDVADSAAALLQRADVAMYVAKGRSTGVAGYDPRDDVNTIERLALLGDLRRALSNDELFLVYQPKISLTDGALGSVEALLRWRHPVRGMVPPDKFIPLAENTGLIGTLTKHVLDTALAQARTWMDAGLPLNIAVNTSARNLHDEEFDRTVRSLLIKHGVSPSTLILEVTESALMADPVRATQLLERLHAQGISISIDDFGAGYTSIKQLRNLPISELKVDRSFVQAMEQDEGEELIVRSVIELGRNLGLTTVAEGVETPDALVRLASFGCDIAQGYVLARPMPAEDLDRWRAEWRGLPTVSDAGLTTASATPGTAPPARPPAGPAHSAAGSP
ncbi:EAL domain-containing protein [Kineosporia sp. J2-2]|uniref:EAL domain-containing protein n=1 Tax=Kineosporia corallincola TaxID=2835133 RepID=A0ABS5TSS9_9ACTN|nr:EAL domain-containing protein [Kineosporia corallincola]MBT0773833.1 EAL domain-containing protein [Kineosporia corallincola]